MGRLGNSKHWWRGLLLVFLVYTYFLLFCQFTFLHLLEQAALSAGQMKGVLSMMAAGGIGGSLLAVYFRRRLVGREVFSYLLLACAGIAGLSAITFSFWIFMLLAGIMGCLMGVLTVSIAALLPAIAPAAIRGRLVGAGTGLAYFVCNLPLVFASTALARSWISAGLLLAGVVLVHGYKIQTDNHVESGPEANGGWHPVLVVSLVLVFSILIWFDSAVFYLIQNVHSLKQASWGETGQLYANAGLHLIGALLAGWMLDTSLGFVVLGTAWLCLVAGALGLQFTGLPLFAMIYVIGVSLYSTALVCIPSLRAHATGDKGSFMRAALVFAIAGWICSGLGIGMAENLERIPVPFVILTLFILVPLHKLSVVLK